MRILGILVALLWAASTWTAKGGPTNDTVREIVDLGTNGVFRLLHPLGWGVTKVQTKKHFDANLNLGPVTRETVVKLTVAAVPRRGSRGELERELDEAAKRTANQAAGKAEEKDVVVERFKTPRAFGSFVTLTDRTVDAKNPKAGEYKFMRQGAFIAGGCTVAVTILTSQRDTGFAQGMAVLESMEHASK